MALCAFAATPSAPAAGADESPSDQRFHVSRGALSGSDAVALTPEGRKIALTPSFAMAIASFTPDPYVLRCKLVAVKYTLKKDDQKEILGDHFKEPDPEDPFVLHAVELRNAAGKFGANAVYLMLNDSDLLEGVSGLHDCTIMSKDGNRYRGEMMNEVACQDAQGKSRRFSQYAGKASFYSCPASVLDPSKTKN